METPEQILARLTAALPGVCVAFEANPAVADQGSLVVASADALAVATWLRDDPALRFDACACACGVDWPERVEKVKTKERQLVEGVEKEVEETVERTIPGRLEAVYHLYSTVHKHGPVVLRQRTGNRTDATLVTSLTPVWRACEFQEREAFDLFGIRFAGHPDLRRILMWDGYVDHPMRKDYVEPDDYEYEPTPHDDVLDRAKTHYPAAGQEGRP